MIDFNVLGLGIFGTSASLLLPGIPHSLADGIFGFIGVAITNGGLFVVTVEFQKFLLGGFFAEALGFFDNFFKLNEKRIKNYSKDFKTVAIKLTVNMLSGWLLDSLQFNKEVKFYTELPVLYVKLIRQIVCCFHKYVGLPNIILIRIQSNQLHLDLEQISGSERVHYMTCSFMIGF